MEVTGGSRLTSSDDHVLDEAMHDTEHIECEEVGGVNHTHSLHPPVSGDHMRVDRDSPLVIPMEGTMHLSPLSFPYSEIPHLPFPQK